MDHGNISSTSSSPLHRKNNNMIRTNDTGDNISQVSQPNSDISAEISIEKYQRLATEYAKVLNFYFYIL